MNIEEFVSLLKNNLDLKRRDDYIEYGDILDLLEEINSSDCKDKTPKVSINKDKKEDLTPCTDRKCMSRHTAYCHNECPDRI